jgi:hypothetical protein
LSFYINIHILVKSICPKLITREWQGHVLRTISVPEKGGLIKEALIINDIPIEKNFNTRKKNLPNSDKHKRGGRKI